MPEITKEDNGYYHYYIEGYVFDEDHGPPSYTGFIRTNITYDQVLFDVVYPYVEGRPVRAVDREEDFPFGKEYDITILEGDENLVLVKTNQRVEFQNETWDAESKSKNNPNWREKFKNFFNNATDAFPSIKTHVEQLQREIWLFHVEGESIHDPVFEWLKEQGKTPILISIGTGGNKGLIKGLEERFYIEKGILVIAATEMGGSVPTQKNGYLPRANQDALIAYGYLAGRNFDFVTLVDPHIDLPGAILSFYPLDSGNAWQYKCERAFHWD